MMNPTDRETRGGAYRARAIEILRQALSDPTAEFRAGQWEAILGALEGRRQLIVQRTGWGKSMVYFLATRLLREEKRGFTMLISPLLALMRDQIRAARERLGIRAETINSDNTAEWKAVEQRLASDEVDILFISPERLANENFQRDVLATAASRVGLFVVDEAHCISDWGHDFRPDYRRIVSVLRALPPNLPVLATTATANKRVIEDVVSQLGQLEVVRGPLARESLALQNLWLPEYEARMAWLAEHLGELPGSGIIYVLTRRDAERLARWLRDRGWPVEAYHSGLDGEAAGEGEAGGPGPRERLEEKLRRNELKALVATVALGMGFDKPDLGFVVHVQRPPSLVHYYQQVGRAGRALEHAVGVLMGGDEDEEIIRYFIETALPPRVHVQAVLGALNRAPRGLTITELQEELNLPEGAIEKCLKFLAVEDPSPVSRTGRSWSATPIAYVLDEARAQALRERREAEQREMTEYLHARDCLMERLCRALDDPTARPCGRCANCLGRPVVATGFTPERAIEAARFLRRCHVEIRPRGFWPSLGVQLAYATGKAITSKDLLSGGGGGRRAMQPRLDEGRALCLWGDGGWGRMVREDKYQNGRFRDELVEACAEMIREWAPTPPPGWVTCIPSRTRPELVPDFARRLAARLGLPFAPAIAKVRDNRPQKYMANSAQQVMNLLGVFAVDPALVRKEPVLLVDDVVDSRWTVTIAGLLLMKHGCPSVRPIALASNSVAF